MWRLEVIEDDLKQWFSTLVLMFCVYMWGEDVGERAKRMSFHPTHTLSSSLLTPSLLLVMLSTFTPLHHHFSMQCVCVCGRGRQE